MIFNKYAKYYDEFYKDMVDDDMDYILKLKDEYSEIISPRILSLGCGTGRHDTFLSELGYDIIGIDKSKQMIKIANKNKYMNKFMIGDIRDFKLSKKFDMCMSLFHIISYLQSDDDIIKTFKNINKHLKKDSLFIFDVWYGPAVLNIKPTKNKKVANGIKRICTPTLIENEDSVDVNYKFINGKKTFNETHKMRYFFQPELKYLLNLSGFEILKVEEWKTGDIPSLNTWGVCFICRKIK